MVVTGAWHFEGSKRNGDLESESEKLLVGSESDKVFIACVPVQVLCKTINDCVGLDGQPQVILEIWKPALCENSQTKCCCLDIQHKSRSNTWERCGLTIIPERLLKIPSSICLALSAIVATPEYKYIPLSSIQANAWESSQNSCWKV